ncbi:MAG: PAS domain S-box protein [bacterium]|nr:PAS domain S-box protein [bacterium]
MKSSDAGGTPLEGQSKIGDPCVAVDYADSAERYRQFFQCSPIGMYCMTLDDRFIEVNAQYARIFGYESPQELYQSNVSKLFEGDAGRRDFINLLTHFESVSNYREIGRRKDGRKLSTLESARLVRDEFGVSQYIEGTLLDITELVELEERSSVYVWALEEARGAILIASPEGNIQYANSAACELYGYPPEQLVGMNFRDLVPESERSRTNSFPDEVLKKGRWVGELNQLKSDGKERVVKMAMTVVPDSKGDPRVMIAFAQDISEVRWLESHLQQAQKMEAIGLLASGLAHNIISPLSAIVMTAEMTKIKYPQVSELDDVLSATGRIQEIISNLMSKSRQEQSREVTELDINKLVKIELKFLEANLFFKHNVTLEVDLGSEIPIIRGLYGDFSQVFQNLVGNALDAMISSPEPVLTIKTNYDKKKGTIALNVRDTGCGIPSENVRRIFEPFFTTKSTAEESTEQRPNGGTGLGLCTVQQILGKYKATVTVESEPGRGSQFTIFIPAKRKVNKSNQRNQV